MNRPPLASQPALHATATRLTPTGRAAIATVAVEGDGALEIVGAFFRSATSLPLENTPIDRIRFGTWQHPDGDREEVVVCRRADCLVEIHCHGGDAAVNAIIAALAARGAQVADQATWLRHRLNDTALETTHRQLAAARTQRTAGILLDQLQGAWSQALARIATQLAADDRGAAQHALQRLHELAPVGQHLTDPWQVVVVGRPNVGKSSLVNTMLGFSRCIVFDQPGTTRDIVATHTALDGWPIELMDSAGLRASQDKIESEGVRRALSQVAAADLVVHVSDATRPDTLELDPAIAGHPNVVQVQNKSDLAGQAVAAVDVRTSAVTQEGVEQLIELLVAKLIPRPPLPGEAVPISAGQAALVEELRASVATGNLRQAGERLATEKNP